MAANSLFAGAIQALCVIAYSGEEGTNAETIAKSLKTNPVVVRRLLKALERQELVTIRQGRHGGVTLDRAPKDITLEDIYKAVGDEGGLFAFRQQGNPRCLINRSMKGLLTPVFAAANEAVQDSMRRTNLATLVGKIR